MNQPLHVTATLRTRAGEFVGRAPVPDFRPPAEVLVWGDRTFQHVPPLEVDGQLEYRECMAFVVVQPVDHSEPVPERRPGAGHSRS